MEKNEYRYRFWYRYRPKFMVSDWYRIESKKAGIAHHYDLILWSQDRKHISLRTACSQARSTYNDSREYKNPRNLHTRN